jgi:hypothetical protein
VGHLLFVVSRLCIPRKLQGYARRVTVARQTLVEESGDVCPTILIWARGVPFSDSKANPPKRVNPDRKC